jgi:hypothetical protein
MSHRPPPRPRAKAQQASVSAGLPPSEMVRIAEAPRLRRLYGFGNLDTTPRRLLSEPGAEYTQVGNAPYALPNVLDDYTPVPGSLNVSLQVGGDSSGETARQSALDKKRRQWSKWVEEVIPMLVEPYLSLLSDTRSLRYEPSATSIIRRPGNCEHASRLLKVICVYFESVFSIISASMKYSNHTLKGLRQLK